MRLSVIVSFILSLTFHTVFIYFIYHAYENDNKNKDVELTVANFFIDTAKIQEDYFYKTDLKDLKTKQEDYKNTFDKTLSNIVEDEVTKDEEILTTSSKEANNNEEINIYIDSIERGIINGIVLPIPPYPAYAKKKGMSGKSVIDILIDKDGSIESVNVFLSSGYKILDNAAKETIMKSWRLPAPGKKIVVRKIFEFELID